MCKGHICRSLPSPVNLHLALLASDRIRMRHIIGAVQDTQEWGCRVLDIMRYNVDMELDLPDDHPLTEYHFTAVDIESADPPTLVFDMKNSFQGNRLRFVKIGKYWTLDMSTYGKESGSTYADACVAQASNPMAGSEGWPGGLSPRCTKSEGLALRRLYNQLFSE